MGIKRAFKSFWKILGNIIGRIDELIQTARRNISEVKMITVLSFTTGEGDRVAVPLGWAANKAVLERGQITAGIARPSLNVTDYISQRDVEAIYNGIDKITETIRGLLLARRLVPKLASLARLVRRIIRIAKLAIKVAGLVGFLGGPALAKKIADIVSKVNKYLNLLDTAMAMILRITRVFDLLIQALTTDLLALKEMFGFDDSEYREEDDPYYKEGGGFDRDVAELEGEVTSIEFDIEILNLRRAPQNQADCHRFVEGLACIDNLDSIIGTLKVEESTATGSEGEDLIADYEYIVGEEFGRSISILGGIRNRLEYEKNPKGHIERIGGGRGVTKTSTGAFHIPHTIETKSTLPTIETINVDWRTYENTAQYLAALRNPEIDTDDPNEAVRQNNIEKASAEEARRKMALYSQLDTPSPDEPCPVNSDEIRAFVDGKEWVEPPPPITTTGDGRYPYGGSATVQGRPRASSISREMHDTDGSLSILLWANDYPQNRPLTYSIITRPTHGVLGSVNGKRVTYTPQIGFWGPDSFTFMVQAGNQTSEPATVRIEVKSIDSGGPFGGTPATGTGEGNTGTGDGGTSREDSELP